MNLIFCSTLPRVEEKAPRVEEPKFGGWSTRFGESRHSRLLNRPLWSVERSVESIAIFAQIGRKLGP